MTLVEGENGLTVGAEEDKVGFPMAWGSCRRPRTFREGDLVNEAGLEALGFLWPGVWTWPWGGPCLGPGRQE